MGHLDSQRSLPVFKPEPGGLSPLSKKLRLAADHSILVLNAPDGHIARLAPGPTWITYPKAGAAAAVTDLPATPSWVQRDVLGELTAQTGYKPVSFVAVDETWTAMRFRRV